MNSAVLAIETSHSQGSVALRTETEILFERSFVSGKSRNSDLFPVLEDALQVLSGIQLSDILVGTGPGSFNGTRVAIALAQAIGLARHCPAVGLSSFLALPSVREKAEVAVIGDARRATFYLQHAVSGRLRGETLLLKREELQDQLAKLSCPLVTNDDCQRMDFIAELSGEAPSANLLAAAWFEMSKAQQDVHRAKTLEPAYLRPPHIGKAKPRVPLTRN